MIKRSALILAGMTTLLVMTGCGKQEEKPYKELIVVNVYDTQSVYTGLQAGWYGKILEDELNLQLNFLDTDDPESLKHADLLICESESLAPEELMENFSLLNLEEYLEEGSSADLLDYRESMEYWNESLTEQGIYVIPSQVSRLSDIMPTEENIPRYGLYLNWEAYEEAGMPDIEDMDELLDVMEKMNKSGHQGLILCNDEKWDLLDHITYLMGTLGYERDGLIVWKEEGKEYEGLLEEDSGYVEALLWLREAYNRGLLAASSRNKTYEKMTDDYAQGKSLLSIWPGLDGQGYELAPVEEMKVVSYGCAPSGNIDTYVAVMADTSDPQRVVDLIGWLYSTEGIMDGGTDTALKAAGPQGLTWEVVDGNPELTEFGRQVFAEQLARQAWEGAAGALEEAVISEVSVKEAVDVEVPQEWGGSTWQEGSCKLSLQPVVSVEVCPSGFTYNYTLWETTIEQYSSTSPSWQEKTESCTPMEYLMENDLLSVIPGYVESTGDERQEIVDKGTACREVIVDYSWKIIFSETEEECERLLEEMHREAVAAGYSRSGKVEMDCE